MFLDEHRVGRGLATTRRRPIHHVVVKERKSMEQFQGSTRIDHVRSLRITAAPDESPVTKRWTQSFAAGKHEPANLPNRGDEIIIKASPPRSFRLEQSSESVVNSPCNRRQ
jgi:hypothetical protein